MQYFQILIAPHKYPNDKETKTKNNCHYSFIAQPKYNWLRLVFPPSSVQAEKLFMF